jgi:hypothetical protein
MSSDPIQDLNIKVSRSRYLDHETLQSVSVYGYNQTENKLKGLLLNDNSELKVSDAFNTEKSRDGYAQVYLYSAGGASVKADTTCVVQPDSELRDGWNAVNSVAGTKFNYYIFNGAEEVLTLGDVSSLYWKGYVNRFTGVSSVPFLQIYTKPTGVGDAGAFYHSRINYIYANDDTIGIGEECLFYAETVPTSTFTNRKIKFNNKSVVGDGLPAEEVLFIVCASDSGAGAGTMNSTINLVGFNDTKIKRNFNLISQINVGNEDNLNVAKQTLSYGKNGTGGLHPLQVDSEGRLVTFSEHVRSPEGTIANILTVPSNQDIGTAVDCGKFKYLNVYGVATGNHSISLWTSSDQFIYYFQEEINPTTYNGAYNFYLSTSNHLQYILLKNGNTTNTFNLKYTLSN